MKILFVHEYLGAWAGAEANLIEVASALQARGHALALLHGSCTGRAEEMWCRVFSRRFPAPEGTAAVEHALEEFRPDVIFLHNSPGLALTAGLAVGGVPVVRMVHDHRLFCLRGCRYSVWSREPCTKALSPLCLLPCGGVLQRRPEAGWTLAFGEYLRKRRELELHRGFARLVVASEYMHQELRRNGFRADQIEIHAPVPGRPLPAAAGRPAGINRIVFAGQIVRGKGVDVLLESLALVRAPFECFIMGDGNHRAHCEALSARLGLEGRVTFTGYVPATEVEACFATATVAVFSSVWPEPFGLAGLEALRHGLPVVAFDVGGVREWLDDGVNGLLAPWMDRAGFARRIEVLLEDKEYARRLGERGRALAAARFDFARYIAGLEDLFARVKAGQARELAG